MVAYKNGHLWAETEVHTAGKASRTAMGVDYAGEDLTFVTTRILDKAGRDVPTADMRETYTKTISRSKATSTGYKKRVASLVGKVNNSSFKGWSPGEIMFIGCSYSTPVKGASKVTVTFNFRIMPNESNAKIANINVGSKQGFEYLWARSKTVKGTDGKPKVEVQSAYKSVVCETGNFSELGI